MLYLVATVNLHTSHHNNGHLICNDIIIKISPLKSNQSDQFINLMNKLTLFIHFTHQRVNCKKLINKLTLLM